MTLGQFRTELSGFIHESEYCIASARLDYPKSAWKSVGRITGRLSEVTSSLPEFLTDEYLSQKMGEISELIRQIVASQQERDIFALTDTLEIGMIPWAIEMIKQIDEGDDETDAGFLSTNLEALMGSGQKEICDVVRNELNRGEPSKYVSHYAQNGDVFLCLKNRDSEYRLMSGVSPYMDALYYFYNNRVDKMPEYLLAGANMIYEAFAILKINVGTKVCILEEDADLLKSILACFDLKDAISSGRLTFRCRNGEKKVQEHLADQSILVNAASIRNTSNDNLKRLYERYRQITLTVKEQNYLLEYNFACNIKLDDEYVTALSSTIKDKTVYIVAGGPSLNKCMDMLKNKEDESVILCVGTSAGKMLKEGINPELVIISDPLPEIQAQLDYPFNYEKTSLIYLSTGCHEAVAGFKGKRYIVYQEDFDGSEQTAKDIGVNLFKTGGSVSTLALDVALQLAPKKIILLGLDLAYTGNQMHASGIHEVNDAAEDSESRYVRSIDGEMIPTAQTLDTYRKWIESRLHEYQGDTEIINISDGAFIEGMKNIPTQTVGAVF